MSPPTDTIRSVASLGPSAPIFPAEPYKFSQIETETPISICHIVPGDMWAGAEAQITTLLAGLSLENNLSVSAVVLGDGRIVAELQSCGIETKVIHEPHRRFLGCYREAAGFLRHKNVQILHSHKSKDNVLAFLLANRLHIPHTVRTMHGLPEPATLKDRLVYAADRRTAPLASRLISVSSDLAAYLRRYVPSSKVEIVHNVVDLRSVRSTLSKADAKRRLGISADSCVIGTAARLAPVKRLDIFLATAQFLAGQVSNLAVVIAGEGGERRRLQSQICGTAFETHVFFLGHRDDIYDVLRAMDLLLITSDHEGLPTVLLEAMALGVPVISRNVGGIPEVIRNGVNGLLVDSPNPAHIAEASLQLLGDASKYAAIASAGWQTVTRDYLVGTGVKEVARIYQSLTHD